MLRRRDAAPAGDDPDLFGERHVRYVDKVHESIALNDRPGPCVIISASGMCEAGRVLHHLKHNIEDPRSTILIVGFQAPDTLGRRLVDRRPEVRILGRTLPAEGRGGRPQRPVEPRRPRRPGAEPRPAGGRGGARPAGPRRAGPGRGAGGGAAGRGSPTWRSRSGATRWRCEQWIGLERFPHDCSGGGTGVSPVRTGETPVPPDYGRYTHARAALTCEPSCLA